MAELVDARDLKSLGALRPVRVRVPLPASENRAHEMLRRLSWLRLGEVKIEGPTF